MCRWSEKLTKDNLINALIKEELKTIKSDSKYELKERIDEFREKSGAEEEIDKEEYLINTFMDEYIAAQSQN